MRIALFAAVVALAVVILVILVKKDDDSKPAPSVAPPSHGSPREARPSTPSRAETVPPAPIDAAGSAAASDTANVPSETAVADAFAALTAGDAKNALAIAEQVLAREPDHKGMQKVAAMAACALGKADVAQTYFDAVDRGARSSITSICKQHGIRLQNVKTPLSKPSRLRRD